MKLNIYCLRFNNKFNNIVKRLKTVEEYKQFLIANPFYNVNFNFSDGILTKQIITSWQYDENPDYVILEDTQNVNIVHSRWYVIDADFKNNGTYELTLKRDSLADNIDNVLNSTCYIDKGKISDDSPLQFNKEPNINFNEIKKEEHLLKNQIGCPWIIAYLARKDGENKDLVYTISFNTQSAQIQPEEFPYPELLTSAVNYVHTTEYVEKVNIDFNFDASSIIIGNITRKATISPGNFSTTTIIAGSKLLPHVSLNEFNKLDNSQISRVLRLTDRAFNNNVNNKNVYTGYYSKSFIQQVIAECNGKTYNINGKPQTVNIVLGTEGENVLQVPQTEGDPLNSAIETAMNYMGLTYKNSTYNNKVHYKIRELVVALSPSAIGYEINVGSGFVFSDGAITKDAPYEIIAMPYTNDIIWTDTSGIQYPKHSKILAKAFMEALANKYNDWCYDIQIVPYISWDKKPDNDGVVQFDGKGNLIHLFDNANQKVSFAIRLPLASDKIMLPAPDVTIDPDKHRSVTCDKYRLVSPNGQGDFEFNPLKNGGIDAGFEADFTLKPYNPYINIHPIWGGLYGNNNLDDYRGLICGGDFGLARLNNQWVTYELNNKNYQQTFNRQIESMDYYHRYDMIENGLGAFIGAGASGAGIGALTANPIAGAIAGGVSLLGGVADQFITENKYQRQREDKQILFDYQLGNVKARAQSLGRVTGFNVDNKLFPYLEYYSCTDEEKEIYNYIMTYQGQTVGVIGKLKDYINNLDISYIRGTIIHINGINDDSHIVNDINNELQQGVRIDVDTI